MIPTQARFLFIPPRNPYSHRSGILIHISPERLFTCSGIRNWRPLALLSLKLVGGLPSVLKCYCVLRGFDDYLSRSVPVYPKGKLNKQQPHREDTSGKADEVC